MKNLVALVLAAGYFACVCIGERTKLPILARKIFAAAKRFFGIPPFRYYALTDGMAAILSQSIVGPIEIHKQSLYSSPQLQLELFDG
ncbi:MAG: hypothetical protein ACE5OP_02780 [Candidatus Glassbacteria bacterium]